MSNSNEDEKIKSLISAGADITGSSVGATVGFLAGGPGGAAVGGALGEAIAKVTKKLLSDFANRSLSKREEVRVGSTAEIAILKIKMRLDSGNAPRNDNFFKSQESSRSSAEEIFEGVLLKSKNEHEEKKIKFYANIFANVAFWPGISIGQVNHILQVAGNLTYRQMCVLSMIERKNQIQGIYLSDADYRHSISQKTYETVSLLLEIYPMYNLGLILMRSENSNEPEYSIDWAGTAPNRLFLAGVGSRYYRVMELQEIPEGDIKEVAMWLS